MQHDDEFQKFLRDVQLKAQSCKFSALKNSMVPGQLVCGQVIKSLDAARKETHVGEGQ